MMINPILYKDPKIDLSDIKVTLVFYNYAERGTLMVPEGYLSEVLGHTPSMSILSVAAILKKYSCDVKVIDAALHGWGVEETIEELKKHQPDVVGLTITSADFNLTSKKWIQRIKKDIGAKIMVGGELATFYPAEVLSSTPEIDYVFVGECDLSLGPLLAQVRDSKPLEDIPGVGFRNKLGQVTVTPKGPAVKELESLPFLPYYLEDYSKYVTPQAEHRNYTGMLGARSCPFTCNYCIEHYPKYVAMSPKRVVDEIEWSHHEFNMNEYDFWDPVFNIKKERTFAICDEIIKRKLNISFSIHARCDTIDKDTLVKLKKAGCIRIQYGLESSLPDIREKMNRRGRESNEHTKKIFQCTRDQGISTAGYLVVGFPYQTTASYEETRKFLKSLSIDHTISLPAYIGPGTDVYNTWMEEHDGRDFWRETTLSGNSDADALLNSMPQAISLEEKLKYTSRYLSAVYLRPRQVINIFTKYIFSPFSLLAKIKAASEVLSLIRKN
jgi:anaerobic magnesium-protoporphyrin IX monomethyl ester cyclase